MIDFKTAEQLLQDSISNTAIEIVSLQDSNDRILAENIYASFDHPFFDQSAVDGYLIYHAERNEPLKLVDEIAAGSFSTKTLQSGEAMRIFTGAPIPKTGDTVVMQEYVSSIQKDGATFIEINDEKLALGGNIRKQGGQLKSGDATLKKGETITPSGIGFLASIGVTNVAVYQKPSISIIVTGNEFAGKDKPLEPGKIFESNGVMLQAALQKINIESDYQIAIDELDVLVSSIANQVQQHDIIIVTGGVSVGDYDFTKPALLQNGFKEVFHKVRQKPGKPFLFMKRKDGKIAFGLPGNPRSAMMGFYIYILPSLYKMMGSISTKLTSIDLPIGHSFSKKDDGKTHLMTGIIEDGKLWINKQQASHMMLSMATATIIAILPEDQLNFNEHDLVTCRFIA